MYKLRWNNETGGGWLHDMAEYADLELAELTAMMAFDDEYVESDDIIQATNADDETVQEWDHQDYQRWLES